MSALFAHVEPLIAGRRILVVGNAATAAASQLLDRGARLVQVFDPDPKRVSAAAAQNSERKISFAQLTPHALRDGSFELALIEDVELGDGLGNVIIGVKRALAATGTAIFCIRNAQGSSGLLGTSRGNISYEQFSEALWDQFENVSLWGQSPFLGYSIVQFGLENPPEPVLDNGYVSGEGEAPDHYVAICDNGGDPATLPEMSIVQLPAFRLLADSESGHREKERRAARRVEALEQEVSQLRKQVSNSELERLVKLLEERDAALRKLEARAEAAHARAEDAEAELEEVEKELEKTHARLLDQANQAKLSGARDKELEREATEAKRIATELEQKVAALEAKLQRAQQHEAEVSHLSAGRKALEEEIGKLAREGDEFKRQLSLHTQTVDKLQKRIAAQDTELDELHKQLDETEEFLRDAEAELKEVQAQLKEAQLKIEQAQSAASAEAEVASLEEQLKERGRRIIELENQLRKLDNFARTLKAEAKAPVPQMDEGLAAEFEQLARVLAEREADLVEAEWTIGQLKRAQRN